MPRLTAAERRAAQEKPSYLAVPGPPVPHHLAKVKEHISSRPDIVLPHGRTLVQPRLPPLLGFLGLESEDAADDGRANAVPMSDLDPPSELDVDDRDIIAPERTPPPPDPLQHRRKRAAQWKRWQSDILPTLLPHLHRVLQETHSFRDLDNLEPSRNPCGCTGKLLKIAIVHFSSIDDVELKVCACAPAPVQLMEMGAFPCAPLHPSLAVDLRVLEFSRNLFLQISPNNTAFTVALERVLESMGFQLDHHNSLRRRFGNCLMWYTHLRNLSTQHYDDMIEAVRLEHVMVPNDPQEEADNAPDTPPHDASPVPTAEPPATPVGSPIPEPRGRQRNRRQGRRTRSSSSGTPTPRSPGPGQKRTREPSAEPPPLPFPEPPPRARPSEYLRRRCPACFGNLVHDESAIADVMACVDACFTQKKNKSARDPPKTHPKTYFIPEELAAQTEAYVDGVRLSSGAAGATKGKRRKVTVEEVDEDDDYDHPELLVPRSVIDGCEASFKAADEKREKASTEFFEDTAVMALLCRHDRVLWLINMHSAGEKQFNVIALMEVFFQHLPKKILVGFLYNVACTLERTCRKWGFLSRYLDRIAFAVSVFHAFGHEWACQLLYHPRKRVGFGFTNGEGCERLWHSISHLIPILRISGYHNRLYTLDCQIHHAEEASLLRLAEWIHRRYQHSANKRREAKAALEKSGKSVAFLRAQWSQQVTTQTKLLPRRSKTRGQQAVNTVMLLRAAVKTRQEGVDRLEAAFLDAVAEERADAAIDQLRFETAKEALAKVKEKLVQKETALGVTDRQELKKLTTSQYIRLRMNARALKRRLRDRLRSRKFELDKVERSFRRLVNDQKLYSHTESAVKRREPTIAKANTEYNKLCVEIGKLIKSGKAPPNAVAPRPIPSKELWQLDVDDGIWEDVGLDDDDVLTEPPPWLADDDVRTGIKAMLELDRADEEDYQLRKESASLQVWFAEEWEVVNLTLEETESAADRYQLQLIRDKLVRLCATWQKWLPDFQANDLPEWGPTPEQLAMCVVDAHVAARREDRHYDEEVDDEDEEVRAGNEEDYITLDAVETANVYRQGEEE
ncbi:hypothetical protein B0H11DRAFT_1713561 [Mycena galericulata]|nr:hypothetical protein B0H11DRAFT_1713561 [Mycena galericulata]